MTQEKEFEFVSAAMDGELSDEEFDRLLQDGDVQTRWYEYHLIRDCLQRNQQAVGKDIEFTSRQDFLAKLNAVTQERQAELQVAGMQRVQVKAVPEAANHSFRWFSIAASALVMAVIAWQMLPAGQTETGGESVAKEAVVPAQAVDSAVMPVAVKPAESLADKKDDVVVPEAALKNQNEMEIKSAVQVERQSANNTQQAGETKTIVQ